jgi:hypothetical protein
MEIGVGTQLIDDTGNVRTVKRMELREPQPISITAIYIERDGLGLKVGIRTADDNEWKVIFHSKEDVDKIKLYDGCLHSGVPAEVYEREKREGLN